MRKFLIAAVIGLAPAWAIGEDFHVEEATIASLHAAIKQGKTTCRQVIQSYLDRASAYNGICTRLVTKDGSPISAVTGAVRAGAPLKFPTDTVAIATILPKFDQYKGLPIDYGRMEPTQSDPSVQQQYGMVTGVSKAGQVNALSTLNVRGERSVSCKAECDLHPSKGPLPKSCPAACEEFRKQPDALERAAELDAQYGRHPDLEKMPMYCVALSFKDVFDTRDMRTTGGADVSYATDAPPRDATVVERLRAKGAIVFAKANLAEYNGGAGNPGGTKGTKRVFGAGSRSSWAGTACNPYDTARETGGSSSGSAAGVGANLVQCSICEETGGSCRQPAWRNGVVGFVVTKGMTPYGGAIGADPYEDRAGIQCRTVNDAARVLDALRSPEHGNFFDPRDMYTALPAGLVPKEPYASFTLAPGKLRKGGKPLAGVRIGIVREYMVKHTANDGAISDRVNDEIRQVLRDQLGAELAESLDPKYPDDPAIPNMKYSFQQALAEILPLHMPEFLLSAEGAPKFDVPGFDVRSLDYLIRAAEGEAPLSEDLNLRSVNRFPATYAFSFDMARYLKRRGDAKVFDWASLNANSKEYDEQRRVALLNWGNTASLVSEGGTTRMKMRDVMRMVILKVKYENHIDVFVNPTITLPPSRNGFASQPEIHDRPNGRFPTSANVGIPELTVPAGFNDVVYEPEFSLNAARENYTNSANETKQSTLPSPMPFGISFWGGPGEEAEVLRVASVYEGATKHRKPPPDFGPVTSRPH